MSGGAPQSVLLLHGQPGRADDWRRLIAVLGDAASPLAIDRPGWDDRSEATGFVGNVEAAVAALDAAGIERATVVGHSFGAGVAAWLAASHPERVSRLILAAPAANRASLTQTDKLLALTAIGSLASTAMMVGTGAALRTGPLQRAIAQRSRIEREYLRAVSDMLTSPRTWRAFSTEQRALVRELPMLERALPRITAETVIVAGAADRVVPARAMSSLAAQIPRARLVRLKRAGHLLPHLHAQQLAAIILEAGVPGSRAPAH